MSEVAIRPTPPSVLRELRSQRRWRRVKQVDRFDALYKVYLTGIIVVVVVVAVSTWLGDQPASAEGLRWVGDHGPALLGVLAAGALAVGLRSGSRGGPLAVEPAEVRHVLMAPVDRRVALRTPALHQLRYAAFVGAAVGALAGYQAHRKLPGAVWAWVLCGLVAAVTVVVLGLGAALLASGSRLPRWAATLLAAALVGWAVAAAFEVVPAPFRYLTGIALWPVDVVWADLAGPVVAAALAVGGLMLLHRISLEALERRTALVGQMRFAATLQDLRTVIVLRRQLALDTPRMRPWVRVPGGRRWPVWRRGWQGFARFPLARIGRMVVLALLAGVCMAVAAKGAKAMIIPAGLLWFLVGLDATEPLSQQIDQADRTDALPVERGRLYAAHAAPTALLSVVTAAIAFGGAALVLQGGPLLPAVALVALPAAWCGAGGAAASVVMGAPSGTDSGLMPPEVAGMKIALRTAWPLIMAIIGCVPMIAAASASGDRTPVAAALSSVFLPVLVCVLSVGWLRYRDDIHAWFKQQTELAASSRGSASTKSGASS